MPNIKDVISGFLNKGGGKSTSVLGVDVSSSSIKVVQLRKKAGRAVLETYGELALGPYAKVEAGQATNLPPEIISEGLKDVLRESKVTTMNCGVSIPLSASLITIMEIPKMEEKQLKVVIPLEARKYIPVQISDVLLDWSIIPTIGPDKESDKINVLIVAIHKDTIAKYQEIIRQSGLHASFFEIEIFSTIRSSLDRGITPVMLVDFGVNTTKLYVVEAGIVKNSHSINKGSQNITQSIAVSMGVTSREAEEIKKESGLTAMVSGEGADMDSRFAVLEFIIAEAKKVMLAYERKNQRPITKVVFAGGGSLLKGLPEFAQKRFDIEVEVAHPFNKVETPAFLEPVLKEAGPEFAVAIGTALRKLEELG